MTVVVLTADKHHLAAVRDALPAGSEIRAATTLKELSDMMLQEDTAIVIIDVHHPPVDPLEAVRLVKGTRWDVHLICIGEGDASERALRAHNQVHPPSAWQALGPLLHSG